MKDIVNNRLAQIIGKSYKDPVVVIAQSLLDPTITLVRVALDGTEEARYDYLDKEWKLAMKSGEYGLALALMSEIRKLEV